MFTLLSFVVPAALPLFGKGGNQQNSNNQTGNDQTVLDFTLPSAEGGDVTLSSVVADHSATVLLFLKNASCQGCVAQVAEYQASYATLAQQNAEIVVVSADTKANTQALVQQTHAAFPVLYDAASTVATSYGIAAYLESDYDTITLIVDGKMQAFQAPLATQASQVLPASTVLDAVRQINAS